MSPKPGKRTGSSSPTKGCSDRTAGQLIDALSACHGDLGAVLGDYNPQGRGVDSL